MTGVVHVDHAANEKLYGKLVSPAEILEGKLPPPLAFRHLIDVLNATEEGKYEKKQSDGDSDVSSQGIARGLERDSVIYLLHKLALFPAQSTLRRTGPGGRAVADVA